MKRFYVVLLGILFVSVLLLGFSFAKESSIDRLSSLYELDNSELRIVYSRENKINTKNNTDITLSIINKKNFKREILVSVEEIHNDTYRNVFYKIDNGPEHLLVDSVISLGELAPYGKEGDHKNIKLSIYTKDDNEYNFVIKNVGEDYVFNNLSKMVKDSNSVYTDKDGNIRYYGANVNNYVLYNDGIYRIIGIINGKVRLISESRGEGAYDTSKGTYITLDDFMATYNNNLVNTDNVRNYKSWIADGMFWLNDVVNGNAYAYTTNNGLNLNVKSSMYGLRYVIEIGPESLVINGDGSVNGPYEVAYGS